jgi:two-component system chemotaxis response regulator CheY
MGKALDNLAKFDSNNVCILVIDDDVTTRTLLKKLLAAIGAARIWEAADGIEGLQIAFGDLTPDLILCDLGMEPIDGLAVIGAIRATGKTHLSKVPLVVFTGSHEKAILDGALKAGATGVIPKPHTPRDLAKYLCGLVSRTKPSSDSLKEFRDAAKRGSDESKP